MSETSFRKFYRRDEFVALTTADIDLPLLAAVLGALTLSAPFMDVTLLPYGSGAAVEWDSLPLLADVALIDAAVAAFEGAETTSEPFEFNSFATATSTSATPVVKIDETTPPLDAGTYQVLWCSMLRMAAVAANTGVEAKMRLTRSDGVFVEQVDSWDLTARHAFNGAITFQIQAGQTITALLTFSRLGASGTAEMSGARVSIDQLSPAA